MRLLCAGPIGVMPSCELKGGRRVDYDFLLLVLAGFVAQLVDGALGMGFGVVGTTIMLWIGLSPAHASTLVHIGEVFTTGASGLSHMALRNVDWRYVRRLAPGGMAGGALGAFGLSQIDSEALRPLVMSYLAVMGVVIIVKALRRADTRPAREPKALGALGFIGGFLDATGGGGWGPIVTTTLIGRGHTPRLVVGSVNLTEFFVTVTISATFILSLGLGDISPVLGFLIGGVLAAPFAGLITRFAPATHLRVAVGSFILIATAIQTYRLVAS